MFRNMFQIFFSNSFLIFFQMFSQRFIFKHFLIFFPKFSTYGYIKLIADIDNLTFNSFQVGEGITKFASCDTVTSLVILLVDLDKI